MLLVLMQLLCVVDSDTYRIITTPPKLKHCSAAICIRNLATRHDIDWIVGLVQPTTSLGPTLTQQTLFRSFRCAFHFRRHINLKTVAPGRTLTLLRRFYDKTLSGPNSFGALYRCPPVINMSTSATPDFSVTNPVSKAVWALGIQGLRPSVSLRYFTDEEVQVGIPRGTKCWKDKFNNAIRKYLGFHLGLCNLAAQRTGLLSINCSIGGCA